MIIQKLSDGSYRIKDAAPKMGGGASGKAATTAINAVRRYVVALEADYDERKKAPAAKRILNSLMKL